jgi:hypothetical protein
MYPHQRKYMGSIGHRAVVGTPPSFTPIQIPTHNSKSHDKSQITQRILSAASPTESTTHVDVNAHMRCDDDSDDYNHQIISNLNRKDSFYAINTIMHRLTQT